MPEGEKIPAQAGCPEDLTHTSRGLSFHPGLRARWQDSPSSPLPPPLALLLAGDLAHQHLPFLLLGSDMDKVGHSTYSCPNEFRGLFMGFG